MYDGYICKHGLVWDDVLKDCRKRSFTCIKNLETTTSIHGSIYKGAKYVTNKTEIHPSRIASFVKNMNTWIGVTKVNTPAASDGDTTLPVEATTFPYKFITIPMITPENRNDIEHHNVSGLQRMSASFIVPEFMKTTFAATTPVPPESFTKHLDNNSKQAKSIVLDGDGRELTRHKLNITITFTSNGVRVSSNGKDLTDLSDIGIQVERQGQSDDTQNLPKQSNSKGRSLSSTGRKLLQGFKPFTMVKLLDRTKNAQLDPTPRQSATKLNNVEASNSRTALKSGLSNCANQPDGNYQSR